MSDSTEHHEKHGLGEKIKDVLTGHHGSHKADGATSENTTAASGGVDLGPGSTTGYQGSTLPGSMGHEHKHTHGITSTPSDKGKDVEGTKQAPVDPEFQNGGPTGGMPGAGTLGGGLHGAI